MIIFKEEKQINRPLLYLTGGLVLGETMALWMTGKQLCIWLIILSAFFSCACMVLCRSRRWGREKWSVFCWFAFTAWSGILIGMCRMQYEEATIRQTEALLTPYMENVEMTGEDDRQGNPKKLLQVQGRVANIEETEYGYQLILRDCVMDTEGGKNKAFRSFLGRMNCYVKEGQRIKLGMTVLVSGKAEYLESDRNPGGFDYRLYSLSRGIYGNIRADKIEILDNRYLVITETLRIFRLFLEEKLDQISGGSDTGMLKAILLGQKDDMDETLYELYQSSGIAHVLAISGLHVSVIGMGIWKGFRKIGMDFTTAGALAFAVLFAYGCIAGFGPSVIRAVVMMGISFLAGIVGRTYDLPSALCVPAIGMLLWRPYLLTQAGFQLSFLAVGAVFFPGSCLVKAWEIKGFWQNAVIGASIQAMTFPIILFHFFEFPLYGFLLNLIVVPLMTYVLISGILGVILSLVWPYGGTMALGGAHYILEVYRILCKFTQAWPASNLLAGKPEIWAVILFYLCLGIGIWICINGGKFGKQTGKRNVYGLAFWLLGAVFLIPIPKKGLLVTILDVGQGDGIVIQEGNQTILVDCGSSQERELGNTCLIPFLKSQGIGRLDAVFITHGDMDHISGIQYLLETPECGIVIEKLFFAEAAREEEACTELALLAEHREISVGYLSAGDVLGNAKRDISEEVSDSGIRLQCLHPEIEDDMADKNEASLVLLLQYGRFRMLLTGDVGLKGERLMAERGFLLPVTVLKAGHHGSAGSTGKEFLELVKPSYVIFSYGRGNRYGHPSQEVKENCLSMGANVYETGRVGAVRIQTDGENAEICGWLDREKEI